jgi:hypothetical protein
MQWAMGKHADEGGRHLLADRVNQHVLMIQVLTHGGRPLDVLQRPVLFGFAELPLLQVRVAEYPSTICVCSAATYSCARTPSSTSTCLLEL